MTKPLLEIDSLPAFDRIKAADARPALENVLAENRARLAELTAQPTPTFASLVIPVEELSYRLSRVWSPIGHLNAVANSAEMREAYNQCVPLITEYSLSKKETHRYCSGALELALRKRPFSMS